MIGKNLRQIRGFRTLSPSELAVKSAVSEVTIWKIEGGKCQPKADTIEKLASALEVDPGLLFAGELQLLPKMAVPA